MKPSVRTTRSAVMLLAAASALLAPLTVPAALAATPKASAEAAAKNDAYLSKLPPLIPRELFFGDPEIAGAQISPDGKWISFLKPYKEVMNIWVKPFDAPFDAARAITADTKRPVGAYFWTEDSRYVLYVQDKGGDENFHIYAVDPDAEADPTTGVPPARDLTPFDNVRAAIYAVPEATPNKIIVGLNDRDPALHDVYRLDIDTGERELLVRNEATVAAWVTDLAGNVRLAYRQKEDGGFEMILVANGQLGRTIYSCSFEETCAPLRFHKNGRQLYITTNQGQDVDLVRLMLLDVDTGETELVESDPENQVDFGGPIFSDKTEELIGTVYVGDRVRIYPRTKELAADLEFLRKKLPDGELNLRAGTEDERFMLVSVSRDVNPGQVFLYDRERKKVTKLYDSRPELPAKHLAPMKPVRYTARDGVEIPAYLTIPKGVPPRNLPAVVFPHGGPWARDTWGYDPTVQFLANRGYVVLQPNFRGSTGYGKKFLNAGNKEWGTGLMQHDITDGVAYLVREGIADPRRIGIMGGSYGGYATLAGLTFTPDLYAAGVDIVGPSNIITLLDSIPPYWGPVRKIFLLRVGDPADPEDRKRLEAQSPFFHAQRIRAPLLVIQGANDPRVKQAESDQIVVALRDLGRPVEYLVASDEGHGFRGETNRLAMFAVIEEFLAKHLGGRYQDEVSPAIRQQIDALRVDVKTVKLPEPPAGAEAARTAPLPQPEAGALAAGTLQYKTRFAIQGQQLQFDSTVTIAPATLDERPVWKVATAARTPMGDASDVFYLNPQTLVPLRREASQGPARIHLDFSEDTVSGSVRVPQGEMPVALKLEAPVLASDSALEATVAALPLARGYRVTFRNFDVQQQRVRLWSLRVEGTETVEVPAGTFEAYRIVVEALDGEGGGGTLWVSTEVPRRFVRGEFKLPPAMGGGAVTKELVGQGAP